MPISVGTACILIAGVVKDPGPILQKASFGNSMESLRELQLSDAYRRIQSGSSLKEVAFAVGLRQAFHFRRQFKARFGMVPSMLASSAPGDPRCPGTAPKAAPKAAPRAEAELTPAAGCAS